jgi:hypothetical protein
MPHEIHDRREVQALMARGAQVVEVLSREEYEEDHLPGAIHLPLRKIETEAGQRLDRGRPVVVYCWDVVDLDAAFRREFLDVPVGKTKREVPADGQGDNLRREAVAAKAERGAVQG